MRTGSESQVQLQDIHSILISRLRFMGDVILTTPVIRALRKNFLDAKIAYLVETPYHDLLENNPNLDAVIAFDRKSFAKQGNLSQLLNQAKFFNSLRNEHFDIAIDLLGNPRSAWQTWFTGSRIRVGGNFRGRKYLYTVRVKHDARPKTAIDFHLQYLKAIGVKAHGTQTEVITTKAEDNWALSYFDLLGIDRRKRVVGIHVGATYPAKRWLPERFAQLCEKLIERLGVDVVFTAGPGEESLVETVRSAVANRTFSPGVLSLRHLAALLKYLDIFISNDCGPMHLAPAVGTKTIGIFGPGEPEIWFPYDRALGHRVVHKEIDCSRCHRDLCEKMDCMKSIQVDDVMAAVRESLG